MNNLSNHNEKQLKLLLQIAVLKELYKIEEINATQFNETIVRLENKKKALEETLEKNKNTSQITIAIEI